MPKLEARGVELAWEAHGDGPPVLLLHETAVAPAVWGDVVEALGRGVRALVPERRGWSSPSTPEGYLRTTIEEQSEDAVAVLESEPSSPAVVCGAGVGAVIALDLLLRRPDLVVGGVLIEPPLMGLLPAATEALSHDRLELERAVADGGLAAVVDLYLSGALSALGPGTERLPPELTAAGHERPRALLAELGAATSWQLPLARLSGAEGPVAIALCAGTPRLLRDASVELAGRLPDAELVELPGAGPPHLEAPERVAELAAKLIG